MAKIGNCAYSKYMLNGAKNLGYMNNSREKLSRRNVHLKRPRLCWVCVVGRSRCDHWCGVDVWVVVDPVADHVAGHSVDCVGGGSTGDVQKVHGVHDGVQWEADFWLLASNSRATRQHPWPATHNRKTTNTGKNFLSSVTIILWLLCNWHTKDTLGNCMIPLDDSEWCQLCNQFLCPLGCTDAQRLASTDKKHWVILRETELTQTFGWV